MKLEIMTPAAKEAVLVANTASFLLDRLRKDSGVRSLADRHSVDQLIGWLKDRLPHAPDSAEALVARYMYLAALSMKEPREVIPKIDALDLSQIEWGGAIRELIREGARPTTEIFIGAGSQNVLVSGARPTSSSHSSQIIIPVSSKRV